MTKRKDILSTDNPLNEIFSLKNIQYIVLADEHISSWISEKQLLSLDHTQELLREACCIAAWWGCSSGLANQHRRGAWPLFCCGRVKVKVTSLSHAWHFSTPWTVAYHTPPSMGFSKQEDWSEVPLPSPAMVPTLASNWLMWHYSRDGQHGLTIVYLSQFRFLRRTATAHARLLALG